MRSWSKPLDDPRGNWLVRTSICGWDRCMPLVYIKIYERRVIGKKRVFIP